MHKMGISPCILNTPLYNRHGRTADGEKWQAVSPHVFPRTAVLAQETQMIMNDLNSLSACISLSNKCISIFCLFMD